VSDKDGARAAYERALELAAPDASFRQEIRAALERLRDR
jgi:hypothetical protein